MGREGIKILVVDDEEGARGFLSLALERENFIVEEAENGMEALAKVSEYKPDLILLDVKMPVMEGIEVYKRLKSDPNTREIPVIFCSSNSVRDIQSVKTGVDEYIEKPIDFKELCQKIDRIFRKKGL